MLEPPEPVLIEDETLRDGLQNEAWLLSVDEKLDLLASIEAAGVKRIQVGSFVHPKLVPGMANTDELFDRLGTKPGVVYTALVLNKAGLERAISVRVKHLSISVSASDSHSRKNLNKSVDEACRAAKETIEQALEEGIAVRAGIQSALGCGFEGRVDQNRVVQIASDFARLGVSEINIADTAGLANPRLVHDLCTRLHDTLPSVALSLHLHDTRGLGLANMAAGLRAGVRIFDAAMGGLGGCPFIPNATGNVATEDAAYLCDEMGFETGIQWSLLTQPVAGLEARLGRALPGKASHLSPPPWALPSNGDPSGASP